MFGFEQHARLSKSKMVLRVERKWSTKGPDRLVTAFEGSASSLSPEFHRVMAVQDTALERGLSESKIISLRLFYSRLLSASLSLAVTQFGLTFRLFNVDSRLLHVGPADACYWIG